MKIGGAERPIKFGINQTDLFCNIRGITLSDYYTMLAKFEGGKYQFGDIRDLIWSALKDGARQAGEPFDVDNMTVGDWMDEDPATFISEALMTLVDSLPKSADAPKKKAVA